jgi:aryl-alcohol dehydrogenase-like predicted oxidoreductase
MPALDVRLFGKTARVVTPVGLGGEGVLRTHGREAEARAVILEALDQGITYFDSAKAYAGSEGYYGSLWKKDPETRAKIFQASKSASRDRAGAQMDLQGTLTTLGTEVLELWQIHDVRTFHDIRLIDGPEGAFSAFAEARDTGVIRAIGITGHHDPDVLTHAIETLPVDAVMMPVNPVEGALGGFLDTTLPLAKEMGIAVIGMKILGASYYISPDAGVTADRLIRYALAQGITVGIVGCATPEEVRTLAGVGRERELMPEEEQDELIELFRPAAKQLAYYRGAR